MQYALGGTRHRVGKQNVLCRVGPGRTARSRMMPTAAPEPPRRSFRSGVDFALSNGCGFSLSGYTLIGWSDTANGAKQYELGGTASVKADKTFYAVWGQFFTVTFYTQNSSGEYAQYNQQSVMQGSDATAPADPGSVTIGDILYNFDGWDTDFTNVDGNLSVYAKYQPDHNIDEIGVADHPVQEQRNAGGDGYPQHPVRAQGQHVLGRVARSGRLCGRSEDGHRHPERRQDGHCQLRAQDQYPLPREAPATERRRDRLRPGAHREQDRRYRRDDRGPGQDL